MVASVWSSLYMTNQDWYNQNTDSTVGSIFFSECRLGKWSWTETRLFHFTLNFLVFKQTVQTLIRPRVCGVWPGSALYRCSNPDFTDNPI